MRQGMCEGPVEWMGDDHRPLAVNRSWQEKPMICMAVQFGDPNSLGCPNKRLIEDYPW
tara:strand:+ start:26403 stop:26576 length:174 start_codon:yes stop_codon:yes gene_type:complete